MDIIIQIVQIVVGFLLLRNGFLIFFKGQNHLINGFLEELSQKKATIGYAKRVGLIQFIIGLLLMIMGIVGIWLETFINQIIFVGLFIILFIALLINPKLK